MVSLESLIETYGYAAVLVGTFLEGETILALAGFAASRGYLSLPWVMAVAFVGSLSGDQLWFFVGHRKGRGFIAARPQWAPRVERLNRLLSRCELPIVLGFRFLYGLRNLTPLVLGASGYPPRRFVMFNIAGAAIWSVVVSIAGYALGAVAEALIADIKRYERWLLGLFAVLGVGWWLWWRYRERARLKAVKSRQNQNDEPPIQK